MNQHPEEVYSELDGTNFEENSVRVKPPHRLAPLLGKGSGGESFSGLKPLGKLRTDSPWNEFGKPRRIQKVKK